MKTSDALKIAVRTAVYAAEDEDDAKVAGEVLYILHKLLFAAEQKEAEEE